MDIERGFLEIVFKKIPYNEIYQNNQFDLKISKEAFYKYSSDIFNQYSDDEKSNIFDYFDRRINNSNGKGIFEVLAQIAAAFLTYNGCEIQCKYEQILRWRQISFQLGQDLFTTAYLAKLDFDFNKQTQFFAWSPIIKTNNKRLHNILDQGMAENHFHLGGSTQIFTLSWICLMNHISERSRDFKKIKVYLDNNTINRTTDLHRESLYIQCIKASYIRLYLFAKSHGNDVFEAENNLDKMDVMYADKLQRVINEFQFEYSAQSTYGYLDYAYEKSSMVFNENDNRILVGERNFLYNCFTNIFMGNFTEKDIKYFLVYLKIKQTFRNELIQTNGRVGFKNFANYQDRKEYFISNYPKYEHELVRLALNSTLSSQNIVSLEARICPKDTLTKNIEAIKYFDCHTKNKEEPYEIIEKKEKKIGNDEFKHFYVLHFPKSSDTKPFYENIERDGELRKKFYHQAKEIVALLEADTSTRYRIRGIDACSNEINCRPEVFAQIFRYMTNVNLHKRLSVAMTNKPVTISMTYHAGEDFLDIADGLRAIDEALLFCNMNRGSRLGHALALGLDVMSYYKFKNYKMILRKQDILDNIAWLIGRASEYGISLNSSLVCRIEQKFYEYYNEVYGNISHENITIWDYFNAWKLRGDNPKLYLVDEVLDMHLKSEPMFQSDYFKINREVSDNIRMNRKCRNLYYRYHFDKNVRLNGIVNDIFEVDGEYIKLVQAIQKKIQFNIADKGISIENNPSSNYLISVISKYEQHPIVKLNNTMLTYDTKELRECPQLSVSVNTDDQGVFDTLLENEYALLARAIEKCKDDNGEKKYKPSMVYDWIDHVRKMGLGQVF